jgi:Probable cobalt transporter subunit (CbtA)
MVRALLIRGMLVGALAGLLAAGVAWALGEPQIERAVAFEQHLHRIAGEPAEPELVSRTVQSTAGLATGIVIYGAAVGGIFALVFAGAYARIGKAGPHATAAVIAAFGFVALVLIPQLKYPASPPAVGDPATIGWRTALYFTIMALSVLAASLAARMGRLLARRLGLWNGWVLAGLTFLLAISLVFAVMPAIDEVPAAFPAAALWKFRLTSLGIEAMLWTALGLLFGVLADRLLSARGRYRI